LGRESRAQQPPGNRGIAWHQIKTLASLQEHKIVVIFRETLTEWLNDKAPRLGAALAFYTLFSLAPLLVVILAVAALVYGRQAAQGKLVWEIQDLVGPDLAMAIQGVLRNAHRPDAGLIATALGLLTLALGASSVVVELRDALNTIWHVPPSQYSLGPSGFFRLLKERCYAFSLVLGAGLLLLVSLVLKVWIAAMGRFFTPLPRIPEFITHYDAFPVSFLAITLLFAGLYKMLPAVFLKWSDVIVGACVTSFLFTVGKQLIGLYLGKTTLGSAYGAAGSLVLLLVWVYYSAQIFFLGAEFTKTFANSYGSRSDRHHYDLSKRPG
jgi:membrane protein